jgi:hypothetical protein
MDVKMQISINNLKSKVEYLEDKVSRLEYEIENSVLKLEKLINEIKRNQTGPKKHLDV